jgi:hypothetical protein
MASATDLSGKVISFVVNSTPITFEIVSGSVSDQADQTHYLPTGSSIKRTVTHGRLITYAFQGVLLTANIPWAYITPGTALTDCKVTLDSTAGSPKFHDSANAEVQSLTHSFSTDSHQLWDCVICADGDYTKPV